MQWQGPGAGKSLELARPACQFDKLTYLLDLNNLWKHQMYTAKSDYKKNSSTILNVLICMTRPSHLFSIPVQYANFANN